jgi:nitroreductase
MNYDPIPLPPQRYLSSEESLLEARRFLEAISTRRSVRQFSDSPVDRAVIETCVRAAGTAPSGANHQPWHFACVSDAATKRRIRMAAEKEEQAFYGGRAGGAWLQDLRPVGTDAHKPFLEMAPWLIASFL